MIPVPYQHFIDPTATRLKAVDNGFIYLGAQDTDPTIPVNQLQVFYIDENGATQQVSQPILLNGSGVPCLKNGTVYSPQVSTKYASITLQNKRGVKVYSHKSWPILNQYRTDLASAMGLVYAGEWHTGIVIPDDAMTDKLAYWHNGQFYIVWTDTGFTSVDFDADLTAGKFVSSLSALQLKIFMDNNDARAFSVVSDGVTDNSDNLDKATAWAKLNNASLNLPTGKIKITRTWNIDFPINLKGGGSGGFGLYGVETQGTEILSDIRDGSFSIIVSPDVFKFGCSLQGFSLLPTADANAKGLRLHNVGWNSTHSDIRIEGFKSRGLELGYLQDTVFRDVVVLDCGDKVTDYAVEFINDSNYIYFDRCRFELMNYTLRNLGNAWEVYFTRCHFETGDYPDGRHTAHYSQSTLMVGDKDDETKNARQWNFDKCTFVPSTVSTLIKNNGGNESSQPYYFSYFGTGLSVNNCTGICPDNDSACDYITTGTQYSDNQIVGGTYKLCNTAKPSINLISGSVMNVVLQLKTLPLISSLYAVRTDSGMVRGCTFTLDSGSTYTSGELIQTFGVNLCEVSNCYYRLGSVPYRYFSELCVVHEHGNQAWYEVSDKEVVDMRNKAPNTQLSVNQAGNTISNIIGFSMGQRIIIRCFAGSCIVKFTSTVKPYGASDLTMSSNTSVIFESDNTGVLWQIS